MTDVRPAEPAVVGDPPGGMPVRIAGSSRGRWLIALGVTGVAIAVTMVAVLLLGGRQTPEALSYLPADAVMVAELRLDLPGDQLQKVGNLLAHFPGFADQSTLAQKLDEAGDRLIGSLSSGSVSYTADLKPWISGPAYLGLLDLGIVPRGFPRSALLVATTDGAAGCGELFAGRDTGTETYRGLEIKVVPDDAGACVVDGRYVLAGELAAVRAGLDARADGTGIDRDGRYRSARAALGGEQLATAFVSGEALGRLGEPSGPLSGVPAIFGTELPDWSIMGVRAEDDALILDSISAPVPEPSAAPSLLNLPPAHPSELTRHVPGSAIVYAEVQGAGTHIVNAMTLLRSEPTLAEPLAELDQVLTAFGGAERMIGWVDDAGVMVVNDGGFDLYGELAGVVVLLAPDAEAAKLGTDTYRSLLDLAALGGAVELETTTIDEVEVTTVTLTEAAGLPAGQTPQFRMAVTGRLVVIGTTEAVMRLVLGTDGPGSLAESDAFARASGRGLRNPSTLLYLRVGQAVAFGEGQLLPDQALEFRTNVLPYVSPIKAIHMTTTDGPGGSRARIVMTVSEPEE